MSSETDRQHGDRSDDGQGVAVDKHFTVYPTQRLPGLDSPNAQAFAARDRRSPDRPMFALLCSRDMPARLDLVRTLTRAEAGPFVKPEGSGIVLWPLDGCEHNLILFDQPGGERLVPVGGQVAAPIREDELVRRILPSLIVALRNLQSRSASHRAIRHDNLFYASPTHDGVMLGECVTEPPAFSQPAIYETVSAAMAMPAGRGAGYSSDDVYAAGVLIITLLNGEPPCADMSEHEVVEAKILQGSFATLMKHARVSLSLMEPLRGMLCDDPAHRWTAWDLEQWLNGRHQSPKQQSAPMKMNRPFTFGDSEYWHIRSLARALAESWEAATEPGLSTRIVDWLRRAFGDSAARNDYADSLGALVQSADKGPDAPDRVLASLLIAFDPEAPIRFRSVAFQPEAIGQFIAVEFDNRPVMEDFIAAVRARAPTLWLESQPVARPEFVAFKKAIETVQHFSERAGWGYGLERCLYELNPGVPCRSPMLGNHLVNRPDRLLPALERAAADASQERPPMDAHIAGFCAASVKDLPGRVLAKLSEPPDSPDHRLAVLKVLAKVQYATGNEPCPALAQWLLRTLSPVITDFRNRPYRQKLGEALQEIAKRGSLVSMVAQLDNQEIRQRDQKGFARARAAFAQSEREIQWIRDGGLTSEAQVRKGSQQAALLFSSVLSGLGLLTLTLLFAL